jgi:hypothetical protein
MLPHIALLGSSASREYSIEREFQAGAGLRQRKQPSYALLIIAGLN